MALKDWKKIRNKLIWKNKQRDVVSIYQGITFIMNVEDSKGNYIHGVTTSFLTRALKHAKQYMRTH